MSDISFAKCKILPLSNSDFQDRTVVGHLFHEFEVFLKYFQYLPNYFIDPQRFIHMSFGSE
jgi:hypothetical protein